MLDQIKRFDYRYLITPDETANVAEILGALTDSGVDLLAFSQFPHSRGKLQVDLITADTELLSRTAQEMGWKLSPPKSGFLIEGDGRPNAIGGILDRLAEAAIHVTAMHALSAGPGRYAALLWVKPSEVELAADALLSEVFDPVVEASEESFPASDAPAWTLTQLG